MLFPTIVLLDEGAGCYRRTLDYGSTHDGISLGTAMKTSALRGRCCPAVKASFRLR